MIRLRVKEVAKEKGMSQSALGRAADIDVKTMRRIYRNPYTSITTTLLGRLAEALDVEPGALLERVSPEKAAEELSLIEHAPGKKA